MKTLASLNLFAPLAASFLLAAGVLLGPSTLPAQTAPSIDSPFKGVYSGDVLDGAEKVGAFLLNVQPSGQGRLLAVDRAGKRAVNREVDVTNDGVFAASTPGIDFAGGRISATGVVTGTVFESLLLSGARRERGPFADYAGYWEGTYRLTASERPDGRMRLIVSPDGRIALHVRAFAENGLQAGGTGTVNAAGAFSATLNDGALTFTGTVDILRRRSASGSFASVEDPALTGSFRVSRERFPGEEFLDGNWRRTPWLGRYLPDDSGWIFHEVHGWVFASGDEDRLFLFDRQLGWLFTSRNTYPWVYSYAKSRWMYTGRRADGTRMFFDPVTRTWNLSPRSGG